MKHIMPIYVYTYVYRHGMYTCNAFYLIIYIYIVQQPVGQAVMHETEHGGIDAAQCGSVK